jgi:hypothetical protein
MAYTYTSFVAALAVEMAVPNVAEANFVAILPTIIDDAEQRLYRELDLVSASIAVNGTATPNNRVFALPQTSGHIIVVDQISVIDGAGVRHPVRPATRESVDFLFPSNTAPSTPSFPKIFARTDDTNVLWGPSTDQAYTTEVIGTVRPVALSAVNPTTFLTNYLSDVFFAAAMVSAAGYQRNFGSQSDDPKMAVSWESQLQTRLASARKEELRKSYISAMSSASAASPKDA